MDLVLLQETTLVAKVPDDPALDSNFKEPAIDSLRQRKDEVSSVRLRHFVFSATS